MHQQGSVIHIYLPNTRLYVRYMMATRVLNVWLHHHKWTPPRLLPQLGNLLRQPVYSRTIPSAIECLFICCHDSRKVVFKGNEIRIRWCKCVGLDANYLIRRRFLVSIWYGKTERQASRVKKLEARKILEGRVGTCCKSSERFCLWIRLQC